MTLEYRDRVMETTTTTGTGMLTLAGAVTGYQSFSAVGDGNTTYFCVYAVDANGNASGDWEVALGTYTSSGTTLSRTSVLASSNSGSPVSFGAGTKRVICVFPASIASGIGTVQATTGNLGIRARNEGATTGNTRGNYSVDLQTKRTVATQVASGSSSVIGGGANNTASGNYSHVGGGDNNTASAAYSHVGGGKLNTASGGWSHVGGGANNTASYGGSNVSGGYSNTASGNYSHVGGGAGNTASGAYSHVGCGVNNTASGSRSHVGCGVNNTASGSRSHVGGGGNNTALSIYSHVGGGKSNTASGGWSHVGGGDNNTASAAYSHVGGGKLNTASGAYSHAGGRRAKATHQGSFVFSDSTDADANSSTTDEMTLRFANGVRILGKFGLNLTAIGTRSHVADPSGGATQDAEARTAINAILATLEAFGFHATS